MTEKGQTTFMETSLYKSIAGKEAIMKHYDNVLSGWNFEYSTSKIHTRYGETFVISAGDVNHPTLVLLHGATANITAWTEDISIYARHYRVYAIDTIGDPGKSASARPQFEGAAFPDWLEDIRQALNISQMILIGLSQGGWIAIKYALAYPQYVSQLVLINPGGIVPHNQAFLFRMIPLFMLGQWGKRHAMQMMFGNHPIPDKMAEGMLLISRHFNARREGLPIFTDEELMSLNMPILYVGGDKDGVFNPLIASKRLSIANAHTHIIAGAGHAIVGSAAYISQYLNPKISL